MEPGHFCWVNVPHLEPIPRILDVERSSPEEHENVKFYLRNANQMDDFKKSERILPIKYLNLRSHEELLVHKGKRRPGIILSSNTDVDRDLIQFLRQKGKKHLHGEFRIVVPCYSIQQEDYGTGFPMEMAKRIECLLYKEYFYCPDNFKFRQKMSIARFDRVQVVVGRDPSAISGTGVSLSEEVFAIFRAMFLYCVTGEEDDNLKVIRDLLAEAHL